MFPVSYKEPFSCAYKLHLGTRVTAYRLALKTLRVWFQTIAIKWMGGTESQKPFGFPVPVKSDVAQQRSLALHV